MLSNTLAALLKLPANDRIELALARWESLTDAEREAERCFRRALTLESDPGERERIEQALAEIGGA